MGRKFEKELDSELKLKEESTGRKLTRVERDETVVKVKKELAYISKEE
jgi:hypothetical protein